MLLLFDVLVFGLVVAVVVQVLAEYRQIRRRSPVVVHRKDLSRPPGANGRTRHRGARIVGLAAEVQADGVHLRFYMPPNKMGLTSPIVGLVSTRQREEQGTIYVMVTASGSSYRVVMDDDHARQVLRTFYAWKNGAGNGRAKGERAGTEAPSHLQSR
jgi:hypothetical protein